MSFDMRPEAIQPPGNCDHAPNVLLHPISINEKGWRRKVGYVSELKPLLGHTGSTEQSRPRGEADILHWPPPHGGGYNFKTDLPFL
jgi:hypothetical protein